jgi:hypothetical protein
MASTYRFYLAATIGDGVSRATAFRSKLSDFIVNDGTKDFWDWSNRATAFRFCLAWCPTALHTSIAADANVTVLSPELADPAAVAAWLDQDVGTLAAALANKLEAAGIPVDWITAGITRRQLWRFISAWHFITQRMNSAGDTNALAFIRSNLDSTIGSLPAAVRNRASAWMSEKGLDTSWIVAGTKVRAVVRFIIVNGNFPIMSHSPVSF